MQQTGSASSSTDEGRVVLQRPISVLLWTVAAMVLAGWLALVIIHVDDDYRITHLQGVWMAVTEAARGGLLYPPIVDGEHYAGTRYMPLPILLNALGAAAFGDPLTGGNLLAAGLMATLMALVVSILRPSCPWPLAVALAAAVVGTDAGLQAGTRIGGDLLPVTLQIGALAMTARGRGRRMTAAGILAGLAFASKLTGLWAFFGIATWLAVRREWRRVAIFSAACAVTASVILGGLELITQGGLSEHLVTFSFAGVHGWTSFLRGPNQILFNLIGHASAAVVLFPLAALGILLSSGWRDLSPFHIALGYALLLLTVVYADVGTGFNQILDVVVLTTLAVGNVVGRAARGGRPTAHVLVMAAAASVIWAVGLDLVRTVGFDLRRSVAAATRDGPATRAAVAVTGIVKPGEKVLAEDPSIDVALRRRPVVMDPFMVLRLDRRHPEWVDPLVARIAERRFDLVVLVVPLENRNLDYWWTDFHYGPRVAAALRSAYRADGMSGRYFLYRPIR